VVSGQLEVAKANPSLPDPAKVRVDHLVVVLGKVFSNESWKVHAGIVERKVTGELNVLIDSAMQPPVEHPARQPQ
jgi:hypothetical protein